MPHNPLLDVSPANPEIPEDLERDSKQHEIAVYLWKLLLSYGTEHDKWFLHPFPIHFENTASKRSCKVTRGNTTKTLEGISKLHTFDQWTNQDWQGADTLIGFFCSWTEEWAVMSAPQWKGEPWYAFGAALRVDEEINEVELLIWDPDTAKRLSRDKPEGENLLDLTEMQQRLFDHCHEKFSVTRVWLGGAKNEEIKIKKEDEENEIKEEIEENEIVQRIEEDSDLEQSMKLTGLWIHDCLRDFKITLPKSGEDLRALGYRPIQIEN